LNGVDLPELRSEGDPESKELFKEGASGLIQDRRALSGSLL
jgi:hypothetical protein